MQHLSLSALFFHSCRFRVQLGALDFGGGNLFVDGFLCLVQRVQLCRYSSDFLFHVGNGRAQLVDKSFMGGHLALQVIEFDAQVVGLYSEVFAVFELDGFFCFYFVDEALDFFKLFVHSGELFT